MSKNLRDRAIGLHRRPKSDIIHFGGHSRWFKDQVVSAYIHSHATVEEIGAHFGISSSTVCKWADLANAPGRDRLRKIKAIHRRLQSVGVPAKDWSTSQ